MKHIVSFSGGKDSTAMLLMMLGKEMPVDDIVCCDTGKEFPAMYEHWEKVQDYIGREITILKAPQSFDYYMFEHIKTKGVNAGKKGYGWATPLVRWCTQTLKQQVIHKYLAEKYSGAQYVQYVGIAFDEPARHKNISKNIIHPLYDWGITEKQALEYCYNKGFDWGGLYEQFTRVSCWCCPFKKIGEYKMLFINYPELWEQLKEMDKKSYNQFLKNYSVEALEKRFKKEITWENMQGKLF